MTDKKPPTEEEILHAMKMRIRELVRNDAMILDEVDREYILGLQMSMEMEEPLDVRYAKKVDRIYQAAVQNAFMM